MALLAFDDPSTWEASLIEALGDRFTSRIGALRKPHEYVEDSQNTLLANDRRTIVQMTLSWVRHNSIAAYHGSRLSPDELQSVHAIGLTVLDPASRGTRLERALSAHPNWAEAGQKLESAVERAGRGVTIGNRSGQAHLTLSKAGLTKNFNHYISRGSEFDQLIAHQLLGEEGEALLEQDGAGYVFEFSVPGQDAIDAANPHFTAEQTIERGDVPNIANEFLKALSYRVCKPQFDPARLTANCGLVFLRNIPANWLQSSEAWPEIES